MASRKDRFDRIAAEVREKTNAILEEEIADLTSLSQNELSSIFPTKGDKERFAKLMAIVSASTAENIKAAKLIQNIDDLGEVVVRVLRKAILV